jgi:hypothetical protein
MITTSNSSVKEQDAAINYSLQQPFTLSTLRTKVRAKLASPFRAQPFDLSIVSCH